MWFDSKRNGKMATSLVVQRQHQQGVAHFPLQNKIYLISEFRLNYFHAQQRLTEHLHYL